MAASMYTNIKTLHEEIVTSNDKEITLGILINTKEEFKEIILASFIYIYKDGMYIIFNTMVDMINYYYYGDKKMSRAYLKEADFDILYDNHIEGPFTEKLDWSKD